MLRRILDAILQPLPNPLRFLAALLGRQVLQVIPDPFARRRRQVRAGPLRIGRSAALVQFALAARPHAVGDLVTLLRPEVLQPVLESLARGRREIGPALAETLLATALAEALPATEALLPTTLREALPAAEALPSTETLLATTEALLSGTLRKALPAAEALLATAKSLHAASLAEALPGTEALLAASKALLATTRSEALSAAEALPGARAQVQPPVAMGTEPVRDARPGRRREV